jgi:membrane protease YdiL (CAAX protease family)
MVAPVTETATPAVGRWRWWVHLLILASFPLSAGLLGVLLSKQPNALLPGTVPGLLRITGRELIFFAAIFTVAWVVSRVNRRQLLLQWRGGAMPFVWGVAYSVALRLFIMVLAVTVVVFWFVIKAIMSGGPPHAPEAHAFRPQIENLVDTHALAASPVYFALMLTLVSFVLAGLREELWRAGMLAGINALFPRAMGKLSGQIVAIIIIAVLFGLAHTTQGLAGVLVTTALGVGLGAIMVWHRSIWEAVLAHGFFDASTFVFLYVAVKYFPHQIPGF